MTMLALLYRGDARPTSDPGDDHRDIAADDRQSCTRHMPMVTTPEGADENVADRIRCCREHETPSGRADVSTGTRYDDGAEQEHCAVHA